jgi:hypothetical protein
MQVLTGTPQACFHPFPAADSKVLVKVEFGVMDPGE